MGFMMKIGTFSGKAGKQRKILIFILAAGIGTSVSLFMELEFYKEFLTFLAVVACGFFGGNSIEHIASSMKNKGNITEKNERYE